MSRRKYRFLPGGPVITDEAFSVHFIPQTTIKYEDEIETVYVSGEQGALTDLWALFPLQPMYIGSVGSNRRLEDENRKKLIVAAAAQYFGIKLDVCNF